MKFYKFSTPSPILKNFLIAVAGIIFGIIGGYLLIFYTPLFPLKYKNSLSIPFWPREVYGFLPYWLTSRATGDYSKYLTTLSYFSLTIDPDGSIQKYVNPGESEPGWFSLNSGKMSAFFTTANKKGVRLSLTVFAGDQESIDRLMDDPIPHAQLLSNNIIPLMKKYGFSDLNLDIESTNDYATRGAQLKFTEFTKVLKENISKNHLGTLTIDISPTDFIKKNLVDPVSIAPLVDKVIIMAYDYHFGGSFVTGPVSPLGGAGTESEFDTEVGVQKALDIMPAQKIILGIPLYGYEWETVGTSPRSATVPGSGVVVSNDRAEQFLQSCATCSAKLDSNAQESYVIYQNQDTGTYEQIFYPDEKATSAKINYANRENLNGLALWALGYEGKTIMNPLIRYKSPF